MGEAIDLPLIWAAILSLAVFIYVVLDGFDLGIGILFPYLQSDTQVKAVQYHVDEDSKAEYGGPNQR